MTPGETQGVALLRDGPDKLKDYFAFILRQHRQDPAPTRARIIRTEALKLLDVASRFATVLPPSLPRSVRLLKFIVGDPVAALSRFEFARPEFNEGVTKGLPDAQPLPGRLSPPAALPHPAPSPTPPPSTPEAPNTPASAPSAFPVLPVLGLGALLLFLLRR